MSAIDTEFFIIGAGIVGLMLARELIHQGAHHVTVIEKEASLGCHGSGRNSGVLHAGIYYPKNSLKAALCLQGNRLMQDYCRQKKLPLINSKKVVVAKEASQHERLFQLYERAKENGVQVDWIDEAALKKVEPYAKTNQHALLVHDTAIVNPKRILQSLHDDLIASQRVAILFQTRFLSFDNEKTAHTSKGKIKFKQLINAAGCYADTIAHQVGIAQAYCLIPFKGIYHQLIPEKSHMVNGNIYPVPDLENPFLGVHFTKNSEGVVYVGPTAIPAFGRENYGILNGIDREVFKIIWHEVKLYCCNAHFRKVAHEEPKKYYPPYFYRDAKKLVRELEPTWLRPSAKVGIRPQLIDLRSHQLVMDFMVFKEREQIHILNAVSPAFTGSMAFAKHIVEHYTN